VLRSLCVMLLVVGCSRREPQPEPQGQLRVVSLMPSATEVVAALGATSLLVGVDEYSQYPPEVTGLPKVGSFLSPNLEQIIKLRPSFVLVDDVHGRTAGALRDAKIEVVECPMHALPDVKRALVAVGDRIGKSADGKRLVDEIDRALDVAASKRPGKRPRVLAIIDREAGGLGNLVAAGTGSWVDELLAVVGGENVLTGAGMRYPKLSIEEVLRAQPDVILDLSYAARAGIEPWLGVDVPAAKQRRIVALTEPYLLAPSPRVTQALDALAKAIR
jgi:iron complex transport system substrate-binding protein